MRYSELFGKTRRDAPADITDPVRRLAFRAGLLRMLAGGETVYLPLATRVLSRIETWSAKELQAIGAQELRIASAPNLAELAALEIQSYKHLPARLYWFDSSANRLRLISFEADLNAAQLTGKDFEGFAARLSEWAELSYAEAEGVGGTRIRYSPASTGDLELLRCTNGDYTATRAAARVNKPPAQAESPLALQEVATPHCDTIDSLAQFLGVTTARTAKAVFYFANGRVIFAVVRGDLLIDEDKLKRALGVGKLRFATDDEIQLVGASPGYASPVGVRGGMIVVDDSIVNSPNLVAGANHEGFHLLNTNVPRDYQPDIITDIALARPGGLCPNGDGKLELTHGITLAEAGQAQELSATFLGASGHPQKCFGVTTDIDLSHILIAFVASHNDPKGIQWSEVLSPFGVHIVALNADKPEVAAAVERVTTDLDLEGVDYILDDRPESAGVKFNDADLIGIPVRLTIGPRMVSQGAVEVKRRNESDARQVPIDLLIQAL